MTQYAAAVLMREGKILLCHRVPTRTLMPNSYDEHVMTKAHPP